jgi:hypothetical protein
LVSVKVPKSIAAIGVLVGVLVLVFLFLPRDGEQSEAVTPLWQVPVPAWTAALGGEEPLTVQAVEKLNAYSFGLNASELESVKGVVTVAAVAALTDAPFPDSAFDAPAQPVKTMRTPRCRDVTLFGTSVVGIRYDEALWAKAVVLYSGQCGDIKYSKKNPGVEYVYAELVEDKWFPRRSHQIPGAGVTSAPWEQDPAALIPVTCDGQTGSELTARPIVAAAFTKLCTQAASQGVTLTPTSAFRTALQQKELFDEAVKAYGSVSAASERVSFSDGNICLSRYCQGLAVSVVNETDATRWLSARGACLTPDAARLAAVSGVCPQGSTAASNAQLYGFATPPGNEPGMLEYVLPAGFGPNFATESNCFPYGMTVPAQIAAVFRCRLSEDGVPPAVISEVVPQALVVAQCASGLNPQATVFGGKYAVDPNPANGRTFPMGGLFALAPSSSQWSSGDAGDGVAAANYAAKLWLANRSFNDFFCATGADPDLSSAPLLSEFGAKGPLPQWARSW